MLRFDVGRDGEAGGDGVVAVVNRANQRGGRMLSVLDLLDAGTLEIPLAAWLLDRVLAGSSWLVGARPGGAGKTTIMCAFLAMLPEGEKVLVAGNGTGFGADAAAGDASAGAPEKGTCLVAYEISPGPYVGYIWGEDLRTFVQAGTRGARIVSNLHADTLDEARRQLVEENGVTEEQFRLFDLFLPIELRTREGVTVPMVRRVVAVQANGWTEVSSLPRSKRNERRHAIEQWLSQAQDRRERRVEQVRGAWLAWLRLLDTPQRGR